MYPAIYQHKEKETQETRAVAFVINGAQRTAR